MLIVNTVTNGSFILGENVRHVEVSQPRRVHSTPTRIHMKQNNIYLSHCGENSQTEMLRSRVGWGGVGGILCGTERGTVNSLITRMLTQGKHDVRRGRLSNINIYDTLN